MAKVARLTAMKEEFSRAIDEALAAMKDIEERANSQEWLDYAEEYGFDENDLVDTALDRLALAEQYYDDAYNHLYLDDFAFRPLEEIL